jgi:hypothetical protein
MDKEWRGRMGRRKKKAVGKVIGVSGTEGARRASVLREGCGSPDAYHEFAWYPRIPFASLATRGGSVASTRSSCAPACAA